jgi:plastocyanin
MRRRLLCAFLLVGLCGAMPAHAAYEDAVTVSAYDFGAYDLFGPSEIQLRRGGTVTFTFDGPDKSHTATDGTGLALYDSGPVPPGGPDFDATFTAAGTYEVVCTLHAGMQGTVDVPVTAAPASPDRGDTVTVTWASVRSGGPLVHDVQLRKPGGTWTTWRDDVVARQGKLEVRRLGTWRFRARLERATTGATSDWSRVATVSVG